MTRTLVLGAGFGGLGAATEIAAASTGDHEVVLVDGREHFLAGLRKLWALVGLGSLEEGRRSRDTLSHPGVRFLRSTIRTIDPMSRSVTTDDEDLQADFLIVALGAEPRSDLVPGAVEHAHSLYDAASIPALAEALAAFRGGKIAICIAGGPYKCPPAPFECAFLLDEHLRDRGLRDKTELEISTFQPLLLPNAGQAGSEWLAARLEERDILFGTGREVDRIEADGIRFSSGSTEADLVLVVPPHRAPTVIGESGLCGKSGWMHVDPGSLRTSFEDVFAVGDVTQIRLANGLPLPKAGLFAELQGQHVASTILARSAGGKEPAPFDGRGYCFLELGHDRAALIEGDFFASPEPRIAIGEVSAAHAADKRDFESERLTRWFGG